MKIINVDGFICLVDDEDFDALSKHRWRLHAQGYAYRKTSRGAGRTVTLLMHRVIMNAPPGVEVDHLGLKLDNRRSQLALIAPGDHRRKHVVTLVALQKSRQIYPDEKVCEVCGAKYKPNPRKRKRQKCCSTKCAQVMRAIGRKRQAGTL